jgi:hypothetical protein
MEQRSKLQGIRMKTVWKRTKLQGIRIKTTGKRDQNCSELGSKL